MLTRYDSIVRRHLLTQASIYLTAGGFLVISHYFATNLPLQYFGHLLLGLSIIIFLTLPRRTLVRRLALVLNSAFSNAADFIALAALVYTMIDELFYRNDYQELLNTTQGETTLSGAFFAILVVLIISIIVQSFMIRPRRHRFNKRSFCLAIPRVLLLFGILFLVSGVVAIITKLSPGVFFGIGFSLLAYTIALSTGSPTESRIWLDELKALKLTYSRLVSYLRNLRPI